MLRLFALTCLLAAAAAQQNFYCNDHNPITITNDHDFYLVVRRPSESGYSSGLSCEFNAESANSAFFVEIESFHVSTAVLIIKSGGQTLFRGSSIPSYQTSITTPSKSLQVHFDANGDHSNSEGVKIRVRVMSSNGCPPGWTFLYGSCFGNSSTNGSLNFLDAQRACNSMRSNLLQVPELYNGTLLSFMRELPYNLRSYYTWIGLTDRSRQYSHYWLNGLRETRTSEIGCTSSGGYNTCAISERCGTFYDKIVSRNAIFMGDCSDTKQFACSAPPGGTSVYYSIPDVSVIWPGTAWIWAIASGSVFALGLLVVGIYAAIIFFRRPDRTSNVSVSAGRVAVPPQAGGSVAGSHMNRGY